MIETENQSKIILEVIVNGLVQHSRSINARCRHLDIVMSGVHQALVRNVSKLDSGDDISKEHSQELWESLPMFRKVSSVEEIVDDILNHADALDWAMSGRQVDYQFIDGIDEVIINATNRIRNHKNY